MPRSARGMQPWVASDVEMFPLCRDILKGDIGGVLWDNGRENGNYYSILGLYGDNGKENGNRFQTVESTQEEKGHQASRDPFVFGYNPPGTTARSSMSMILFLHIHSTHLCNPLYPTRKPSTFPYPYPHGPCKNPRKAIIGLCCLTLPAAFAEVRLTLALVGLLGLPDNEVDVFQKPGFPHLSVYIYIYIYRRVCR